MPPSTSEQLAIEEVSPEVPTPLNDEERIRLEQLEHVIAGSIQSFLVAGKCLLEVRDRKLYREQYSTFQDYCVKRWGITERRGLELARATTVAEHLLIGPAGPEGDSPLPADLGSDVLRPLTRLCPELQAECWRLASRIGKPTRYTVSKIVRVVENAINQGASGNGVAGKPLSKPPASEKKVFLASLHRLSDNPCFNAYLIVQDFDETKARKHLVSAQALLVRLHEFIGAIQLEWPQL
jgi:hypothetical protein